MKVVIESEQFEKTLKRLTHEIIERNDDMSNVVLVGIKHKGTPIARYLAQMIKEIDGTEVEVDEIDIISHRDDEKKAPEAVANFSSPVNGKVVILVDDVLYTGRSVRAAMDAVIDLGRPAKIELAILVDRGHRELPIRADFVGKNIPTARTESVVVDFDNKQVIIK
ncbi:MAG: bifunctional pyr operon transcriptional regulator/uracil phosphoribosyltransferase PyrR [Acholeplasmatales bacterium]|nr:bifunctional pyr operon transcriptional regulator/uracil phosphoribosyltransferase PyrR [Acholeplasmatales bacterium]